MPETYTSRNGQEYDLAYEVDGSGELGSIVSVDAYGHLDFLDSEIFMADTVCEWIYDPHFRGFDAEHLWRSEHPLSLDEYDPEELGERWTFHYSTEERPGSIAVTRFQDSYAWTDSEGNVRMCMSLKFHEGEEVIANQGIPISMVSNVEDFPEGTKYIYMCTDCARDFNQRRYAEIERLRKEREASA